MRKQLAQDRLKSSIYSEGECWLWAKHCDGKGYGQIKINGGSRLAHRVSYQTFVGEIPDHLYVCHHCDNPGCIRPDHLFLGTPGDNARDSVNKGRWSFGIRNARYTHPETTARGARHGSKTCPQKILRGEHHPEAKLTTGQVQTIRQEYRPRRVTYEQLAARFGVSRSLVKKIVRREAWRHMNVQEWV